MLNPYKLLKPGDIVEWKYYGDGLSVEQDEMLWSKCMQKWLPIGGKALLLNVDKKSYTWLNELGVFSAMRTDNICIGNKLNNGVAKLSVVVE
jgi:hypothetical protein